MALLLVGCSYSVKLVKCTPGSTERSYVWLVKGDTDVSKANQKWTRGSTTRLLPVPGPWTSTVYDR